jgi:hypothetical protein
MKTVDSDFTDERDKQHPTKIKHRIILQAYNMNGTAITDEKYDLTNSLIYLPEIKSELEDQLNANKASTLSLEFYDNDDTIWDYFGSGSRRWGIKIEQTYDIPNITAADTISTGTEPSTLGFSPNGKYLFVGCDNTSGKLHKYEVDIEGNLTLSTEISLSTVSIIELYVSDSYVYCMMYDESYNYFKIYDYDLTLIGSVAVDNNPTTTWRIDVDSDENHAWVAAYSTDIIYYIDISDKTSPSSSIAVSSIDAYFAKYWNDYLYVGDRTNKALKTYDASTPADVPYSLIDTLSLSDLTSIGHCYLDEDRSILYIVGGSGKGAIVDISDVDDPVLATSITSNFYGYGVKSGRWFFNRRTSDGTRYIYTHDLINHYKQSLYNTTTESGNDLYSLGYNGDNVLAFAILDDDEVNTYTIWQNWITLFEGLVDYQSLRKTGRNRTYFTAYTGEKELEVYNAEKVYDATNTDYLRNITGVTVSGLTGGTTGAKKLEYTYKTLNEDDSNIDEFGLKYEGGEEFLFRVAGEYSLTGSSGQIITLTISDTDDLPRKDAEDTMVVGDTEDYTSIGSWYESQDIATVVGLLWDESNFTISNQNTDIDTSASALSDTWQFDYKGTFDIDSDDYHSCVEDNPPDSDTILSARGTKVYKMAYDSSTRIFTETELLTITDTFANATRVDKILRLPNGNALVVCVSGTKEAGANGWCDLEGIMEIENDGTIDDTWNETFLKDSKTSIAGTSIELMNYTKGTGEVENRNGFYWVQYWLHDVLGTSTRSFYVSFVDIDNNPSALAGTTEMYSAPTSSDCWVAPNIIYHRFWNSALGPAGSSYHCWFLMVNNIGGYIEYIATGDSAEESLAYCTETTINTIRAIRADDSRKNFYLITSQMASDKQYVFRITVTTSSVIIDPVAYHIDYPVFLPDIYKAVAFELDSENNVANLVRIKWEAGDSNIENIIGGFMGHTYSPHPVCYLDDDDTYAGCAEVGALARTRFFIGSNLSILIVPVADFTDLNVRQALNMMAEAYICLWNRPELDTANFISRGNYTDEYTLEKGLYLPQYQITKQPPYLAVEAKNTYYEGRVYLARHPDNYMGEKGDMLQIDNRFITPVNKDAIAKVYYDFYNTIRRIFEIEAYYLIELELFDKIVVTLYDIDGNEDETINTVLVEKSFNNNTKTVKLRLIELDASAFLGTTGFMLVGGGTVC